MTLIADPPVDRPAPRPGRWWPRAAGVLSAVALVATVAWLVVGGRPQLTTGSFRGPSVGLTAVGDGFEDTRYVADGLEATLVASLRNDGPVAVTVVSADLNPYLFRDVRFWDDPYRQGETVGRPGGRAAGHVTIGAGEEAGVLVRFALDRCTYRERGSHLTVDALDLRVRSLGVPSTQRVELPLPVTFPGTSTRDSHPEGCPLPPP